MKTKHLKRLTTHTHTAIIKSSQYSFLHKNPTKKIYSRPPPLQKTPGVLQKAPAYAGLQKRREFAGECVSNK